MGRYEINRPIHVVVFINCQYACLTMTYQQFLQKCHVKTTTTYTITYVGLCFIFYMKSPIPKPLTSSTDMLLISSLGHSKVTNFQHKIHYK